MDNYTVALFGEADKGEFRTAYFCQTLTDLEYYLGNPPPQSKGLFFAIQTLLFHHQLIFFRVREEGYSIQDYLSGLSILQENMLPLPITAIGLPGVGNKEIIHATLPLYNSYHTILLMSESDLYDYLTV